LIAYAEKKNLKAIERENFAMAKRLYSTRAALNKIYSFKKDFKHHLKIKTLRCELPVVNMKKNKFNDDTYQNLFQE
jgi:hypothetical protein